MMQTIREHAQGIIAWTIVGLIIISFALFGLESYLSGTSRVDVATVDGVEISERSFIEEYQRQQERLQTMLGANYRPELIDEAAMKRRVLDGMIDRTLLSIVLEDEGFRAAPQQVAAVVRSMEVFRGEDGQFSRERYEQMLGYRGYNPETFEKDVGRDVTAGQLVDGIALSGFVTPAELNRRRELLQQERDVGIVRVPVASYLKDVQVSDQEIKDYFDQNQAQFTTPERVSVRYIELDINEVAGQIEISDDEIAHYYETNIAKFTEGREERRVRHILITIDEQTDAEQAKQQATQLLERVRAGESFSELAKAYSKDPGSAANGGDLDYFTRGVMDKAFEDAAFSLAAGEVSEPVRTHFGYHLLKVEDIRPAKIKPLDEVREQVKHDAQLQKAELRFYEQANRMTTLAYENSGSLDVVAQDLGLEIKESELFTRAGGVGVASSADVRGAAFSDDVLTHGLNSDPIELETNHYVVVRLNEHRPAEPQQLDQVQDRIRHELSQTKARELARQAADELVARVREGGDPEALARDNDRLNWQRPGFVGRTPTPEAGLSAPVLRTAFRLPRPQGTQPSVDVQMQPNGDAAVVVVYAVRSPESGSESATTPEAARSVGQSEYAAFVAETRRNADVNIYLSTQDTP